MTASSVGRGHPSAGLPWPVSHRTVPEEGVLPSDPLWTGGVIRRGQPCWLDGGVVGEAPYAQAQPQAWSPRRRLRVQKLSGGDEKTQGWPSFLALLQRPRYAGSTGTSNLPCKPGGPSSLRLSEMRL